MPNIKTILFQYNKFKSLDFYLLNVCFRQHFLRPFSPIGGQKATVISLRTGKAIIDFPSLRREKKKTSPKRENIPDASPSLSAAESVGGGDEGN